MLLDTSTDGYIKGKSISAKTNAKLSNEKPV